jgi:hypothetical protein
MEGANHQLADGHREDVLRANLDYTWLANLSARQNRAKIKIVSEDH